ncbi:MAG: glycosyltransferase [Geminicoccaceae bacterium]
MDAGLPIVCTSTAGCRASLGEVPLVWIPPDDVEALAVVLRTMHGNRPARRIYPMEKYRLDARLEALEAFYASFLSPPF